MTPKNLFYKNSIWVSKNAALNADFESIDILYLHKGMRKVINKKAREKCSFLLLLLCAQVFGL